MPHHTETEQFLRDFLLLVKHTHTHPPVQFMNHYYRSVFVHSHNISDSSQIGFVFYHRQIHHNRIVLCQISKEKNQKEPRQHFPFFGPIWIVSNSKAHKNGMRQAALFASFRHRIASSVFLLAYIRPKECFFPQILLEYICNMPYATIKIWKT